MEATIKLDEDEVIKLCVAHCKNLIEPPKGMQWVGAIHAYSGVTVTLEEIPLVPLATPVVTQNNADDDFKVPF